MATELLQWDGNIRGSLRSTLVRWSVSTLAEWLLAAAERDGDLRMVLRCEMEQRDDESLKTLRQAVELLTAIPNPVTWRESGQIGRRVGWLVPLLKSALNRNSPGPLVALIELALFRSEQLVMAVQDSESWGRELHQELVKLHRAACRAARPDPIELATRWIHLQRGSGLGWFDQFPDGYEDVLGEIGLAEFQRLGGTKLRP